jgi:HPt (histidine-containing phosphotransfer) domain-containing protein
VNEQEKLQQQMAQIGSRYIARTFGELQRMQELLQQALGGSLAMMKDLEHLAHKIHGSGAMFGFDRVSDQAGEIEHIAGFLHRGQGPEHYQRLSEQELHTRLRECVVKLYEVTRAAAMERGIDVNAT